MNVILRSLDADRARLGGKAGSLAALARGTYGVPEWFAVASEAASEDCTMTDAVRAAIMDAVRDLCPNGEYVAVRSSALEEDGEAHSFAGQFETYLFVRPEDVPDRVADVWRSALNEHVIAYREQHGLPPDAAPPAVLVQRMVHSTVSGVAFGADPVTGDPDTVVVSAVPGLGTSLVSGECDADTFHVNGSGGISQRTLAKKTHAHYPPEPGANGVRVATVQEPQASAPVLTDEQVLEIALITRRLGDHFSGPQDVEWAIENGEIHVLQSRPITTPVAPKAAGVRNIWDNSNIVESYNGVTTPLTFSFASYVYDEVYRQFCLLLRVPGARIEANAVTFRNMLGLMQGRVYYNLLNWYRVLALLPGFQLNRTFMEQMMGVKESMPDEVLVTLTPPDRWSRAMDGFHLFRSLLALVAQHRRLPRTIDAFYNRLEASLTIGRDELESMPADAVVDYYSTVESKLLRRWDAPLINDFLAMIFFGVLNRLCERWLGEKALANDLLCGQEGIISVEPARRMRHMAVIAAKSDALTDALCNSDLDRIQAAIRSAPEFAEALNTYLDKFGDRCLEELKLESPTLHDDPMPLLRGIGHLARRVINEPDAPEQSMPGPRAAAERRVGATLNRRSLKGLVFRYVLRHAKARVRDRENLRFERTRVFGLVRRIFVTLGTRLTEAGVLDDARDVFYLERNEVFGFVEGRATTRSLRELVNVRRREFDAYREMSAPPSRFETRGIAGAATFIPRAAMRAADVSGDERQGIGCCAGVVRGRVRVVFDPRNEQLAPGEILVARTTDPGWVMLFAAAAALLVERGSLLSHSAIVSREMGIPSVVSVDGLTSWLKTGDLVEMDGATGTIRRIGAES